MSEALVIDLGTEVDAFPFPLDFPEAFDVMPVIALSMRAPNELRAKVGDSKEMLEGSGWSVASQGSAKLYGEDAN